MNQDNEIKMTDDDIIFLYNQYLEYLERVDREELELQKQHQMEMDYALFSM
jgi:chromatin segregation and condensation protein Rec8/ScpA/Scc1 (kleisin family)